MAQVANLKSNIQSKIQQDVNEKKKQLSASSTATQAWSTETPKVTDTPKVTQTAKAMPSVTPKLDLTPVSQATVWASTTTTPTVNAKDLLWSKSQTTLKKAEVPDLLDWETNTTWITWAINKWLYEVPQKITEKFWKTVKESELWSNAINLFDVWQIDLFRFWISSTQWWMQKYSTSPVVWLPRAVQDGEIWTQIKEQRNRTLEAAFNKLEERDQWLSQIEEYKEAKKTADEWAEQWKWIRDAINEWRWDVVTTRVWETMGQMIPAIVVSAITKNPKAAAWTIFTTVYWDAYKRNLTEVMKNPDYKDLTTNQKTDLTSSLALVEASIETAWDLLELAPFMKWKFSISNMLWIKNVILSFIANLEWGAIVEWWEEVATELLQTLFKRAYWWGDEISLQELWNIFSDTFWIMQFAWLIWWAGWAVETHNRNTVIKWLAHEAEKYDNYNDFESAAKRWGIEDEDLIQAWWAQAKWLTNQQANILKYDVNYVENLEEETTSLYEEKNDIEKRLSNLKEESEEKNKKQISKLETRLQEIDNRIQEIDKSVNEYMDTYWKQELPANEQEQQLPKEAWGENLSKQTMKTVQDSGEVTQPTGSELQYKQATWEIETPTKRYIKLIKKLNSKTTRYADSEWKEFKLKEDVIKELKYMSVDEWAELLSQYDSYSLKEILGVANRTLKSMKQWRNTRIKQDQLEKLYKQLNKGVDLKNQMVDELKSLKDKTKKEEAEWISDYRLLTWIWDFESARSAFSGQKTIYSEHLVWLKDVSIKQLEWKITDKVAKKFGLMLAKASQILWIDFNKVIWENDLTLTVWNKDNVAWFFNRDWTKESLTEVLNELKNKWEDTSQYDDLAERTFKACIYLATLDEVSVSEATATLVHEFVHMLDYRRVIDLWLKAYINEHSKISRKGTWVSSKEADYVLKWDKKRETFNNPEDVDPEWKWNRDKYDELMAWTIDLAQMTYDDVTYANEMLYIYDPTEILARYAEQYYLWKEDKEMFDKYSKKTWYWTEEEFKKLIDIFENEILKDKFADYQIDEENRFYHDVMRRIYENKFKNMTIQFAENNNLNEFDVKQMLNEIEDEYARIMQSVEWLKWDIKEEMIAYIQLTNLQTNYEMAKAKWQEYIDKLKTTPQQQDTIDNMTTETIPNPPQDPETLNNWIPYFWGSNIEEWLWSLMEWGDWEELSNTYMTETARVQARRKKNKFREAWRELVQAAKDVFTPAFSRIYNISPRVAWRLATMETQRDVNIYRYRQKAKWFVETLWWLKGKQALEVKMALLDYWALASEQGENIEQYKKDEVAKLKEVLLRNWFKEQDINDMFEVLDDIGRQYQDAGLSLTRTDMYFPRVVKDYEGLIDYMNRVSGKDIKVNKTSLMIKIRNIMDDINMTAEEKEARIRNAISMEFKQPWTTSQHGKERKMWKLSDWWEWIFAYYESPIESLDHYITTMVNATQRQLFLWGMREDANITENEILNMNTAESVSTIIWRLVENWQISENKVAELQKSIMAVLNKKPSPKSVTAIKDVTYISTITNFLSAINQLDDLWMVILKDRSWLKYIVKSIFWKAWIKYDELWLEDAYEMFREEWGVTNWLFKKSLFNAFDRLWKTSFINTAWESMVRQSKNEKTRNYLYTRLQAMYWTESANRMMEKIDANNYMDESGQVDIEILRDLLYQLGSTQPIYTSAMPVTYLNNPWSRLCYALSSFTLKRMDWLLQWTKEVYKKNWGWAKWTVAAWAWLMYVSSFLAMFWAMIWDIWDFMKWDKEETFLWNLINEWIDKALAAWGYDMLDSWLKIWDLSEYDLKLYKQQGIKWLIMSKISPFIFDLGRDVWQAIKKHDANEVTDLAKYVPIIWKLVYYWCWDELESATAQTKSSSWFIRRDDSWFKRREDSGFQRREETGFIRRW